MKIEIILSESINEKCYGKSCFDASSYLRKQIAKEKSIYGVVIIDNIAVKFYFSPMGMDGDIFTNDMLHRNIIKSLIPTFVLNNVECALAK